MIIGFDASRAFVTKRTGTENYSYELLKHLLIVDKRNTYRIYLRNGMGLEDPLLKAPNVTVKNIVLPKLWTQVGLASELLLHKPDILFVPAHTLPVIHRPGLKSAVTIHDLGAEYLPQYHQFPQKLYLNRSTEYAAKYATHLIAVSEATKADLTKRLDTPPKKITVVYEGFTADRFNPQNENTIKSMREKCGISGKYILFLGTIQPRKNLERLIEAFAIVSAGKMREFEDIKLVLAGRRGWLSEPIYEAPAKYNISDKVQFLDYVADEDLPALYSGAEVFAYPSLFEGFGIPILEAMACGTPVITSNISSMPEVGGDAALYVNPFDVHDIAEKIANVVMNPTLQDQLRQKGFHQVQQFSWEKAAKETLSVFNSVAEGKAGEG